MSETSLSADLIEAARRVIEANRAAGRRIAVAESCTGGLVTAALTEVPGSSDVLEMGFVTYSDTAKVKLLGVSSELLETFGAVSIAIAWAMALGALEKSGADVAVSITGIAGPAGGTDRKPVGTVVFGHATRGQDPKDITADRHQFGDLGRAGVRRQAALVALELLMPPAAEPGAP